MNRNFILFLLVFVGISNALWINIGSEYSPGETIEFSVSGAAGIITVDIFDSEGISVFHEFREAEYEPDEWRYSYQYEDFEVELPVGEYTVVAKDSEEEESSEFKVTSIGLVAVSPSGFYPTPILYEAGGPSGSTPGSIEDGKGLLVYKKDGSGVVGADITLTYNFSDVLEQKSTTTGNDGIFSFDSERLQSIRAEYEGETTEIEFYLYDFEEKIWWDGERYSTYVYSDKTLYQPGEAVHISAVIFAENESAYETVSGNFEVEIRGPDYDNVYTNTITAVNSRISFDYSLGEEAPLGSYSVQIRKNESYAGYYNFQVQEYKRPEIDVSLSPQKEVFVVNETIKVDVHTDYYFGGPADAEVKFDIYYGPHYWPVYRNYYYDCMPYPYWGDEKVAEGVIYTQDGLGTIEWNGTNATGDYRIEVSVTDESEVVSEDEVAVSVLEKVNIEALVPTMEVNTSQTIIVLAYDENEAPLDLEGVAKIYKREECWDYRCDEINESVQPVFGINFTTDAGAASFGFAPEEAGSYVLVIEASGVEAREYFYVSEYSWSSWNYLEVSLNETDLLAGESVEATITSPVGGRLTVVTMGTVPSFEFFEINPGINTINLVAEETSTLQFFVIKDGESYSGYANYMVRGPEWIQVDIAHGEVYEPGGVARLVISAEREGAQSNAAASIAIVDQAIVDLSGASWNDIYSRFYGYPLESYSVQFSWGYGGVYYNRVYEGEIAMDMVLEEGMPVPAPTVAGSDVQTAKEEITIRENFVETALWIPYIILENGKKEVIWHIPDTLTTWNITVVANEGVAVGMNSSTVVVTKDVIGRMSLPSALVVDDALAIPITVFNYGEERGTFKITLESSSNIWILGSPIEHLSLEAGESKTIYIPVKAMEAGEGELTLFVEGGEGDAVKLPLEVLELGIEVVEGTSGVTEGTPESFVYDAPEGANVTLYLDSSILGSAFESLDYLVHYPYGCIEQTMSGFLPDVVLVNAINELGVEYSGEENLTELIDDGLTRIYDHQNSDGSWGWFNGEDERITAYVMSGLTIAKDTGIEVDSNVYSKGLEALKRGNSSYGRFVLNQIEPGTVAVYANDSFGALTQCDNGACAELISKLDCAGSYCYLGYDGENKWYHSDIEMTSYAVESLVKNGEDEYARKCVNWLMAHKTGSYWRSTKDTAVTVLALTEYAKATGELESDYVAYVYLDGEEIFAQRLGKDALEGAQLDLPDGSHQIKIERKGSGPLYYNLVETYYTDEIPESQILVERDYSQTFAKVGDEIIVTLKINGSGEFVAVEDPIPMGCEIIKEETRGWWYYGGYRMEARQDKAVFFFDRLSDTEITYKLRVMYKGDFTALPTYAYHMYAPEVSGYSDFVHFTFYEKAYVEPYVTEYNTTLNVHWEGPEAAKLNVVVDGVESQYTVQPGNNEIVVGPGEVSYSFESEEEYFEGEVAETQLEEPAAEEAVSPDNFWKGLLLVVVGAVVLLIVWRQFYGKK